MEAEPNAALPRLSPAPRALPLTLSIRVVLGGLVTQMGWLFVGFGLVFTRVFDAGGAVSSSLRFMGAAPAVEGVASGWRETSMSENDTRVFETAYTYIVDGLARTGVSYATGHYVPSGQDVVVEYLESDPEVSRIRGMRSTPFGPLVAFTFIFPLVGAAFASFGMRRGFKARRLMSTGDLALGTLRSKTPTGTKVNNQTVYELTFTFEAARGGAYDVSTRTHQPHLLEDEARERLVYDPRDPSDAAVLDDLPCRPAIDARGDFVAEGGGQALRAVANLAIPGLTILGHAAFSLLSR